MVETACPRSTSHRPRAHMADQQDLAATTEELEEDQSRVPGIVGDVVADAINAIGAEIIAASNDPTSTIELRNGRCVGRAGSLTLWTFQADETFPVPPETPAGLKLPGAEPVEARVVAVDDRDYVIGVIDELPDDVPTARLSLEPWFIYDKLRDRLKAFDETTSITLTEELLDMVDLLENIACDPIPPIIGESLSAEQRRVASEARLSGLRFVWGPPGTGKTATLAATVRSLVQSGLRVMVLAHANAAVDVAMLRAADMLGDHPMLHAGRVLRVGPPHLAAVRDHEHINPDEIIRRQAPALVSERDQLVALRRQVARSLHAAASRAEREHLSADLEAIRTELSRVEKRLTDMRNTLIDDAVVVGLTLSRVVINDLLWSWPADVVIVDESSMAGLPFLLALSLRGARTLSMFGDFRQLPPIATSKTAAAQEWFARDAFEMAGVRSRIEASVPDSRLSILRTQYRMGSDIAAVVGRFAYFDLLSTDVGADERAASLADLEPASGSQLVLVDISSCDSACLVDAAPNSYSRFNLTSAALAATVAASLVEQGSADIGIISAYRAQARIVDELCRTMPGVTSATTHRFQGSERDAIVLDLVDALPQTGPSVLTGNDPDLSLRLLNVAASRPRGKLVIVADLAFIERHHSLASPARRLIDLSLERGASTLDARDLLDSTAGVTWFETWDAVTGRLLQTISSGSTTIDLSVPSAEFGGRWIVDLATRCADLGAPLKCRAPIDVAASLEHSKAQLFLKPIASMPILTISGGDRATRIVVGGRTRSAPVVSLEVGGLDRLVAKYLIG